MSILSLARTVATTAEQLASDSENLGQLHGKVVQKMQEARLPQMLKKGQGHSIKDFISVCDILAEGCMSTGWCNFVWGTHNYLVGLYPKSVQNEVWSDNQSLVSASLNPIGDCKNQANGKTARIQGRWNFNSGCDHAKWLLLGCQQDHKEPVLALLHQSEYRLVDNWDVMGLKATGSKDAIVEPTEIPRERLLPFSSAINPFSALLILVIAGPVIGGAQSAVAKFAGHLEKRQNRSNHNELTNSDSMILKLSEASAEVDSARTIVHAAADLLDQNPTPDSEVTSRIMRDTAFAAKLCNAATRRLFESSGGGALNLKNDMQRIFRDVTAGCNHAKLSWEELALPYGRTLLENA